MLTNELHGLYLLQRGSIAIIEFLN